MQVDLLGPQERQAERGLLGRTAQQEPQARQEQVAAQVLQERPAPLVPQGRPDLGEMLGLIW